jgi:hypothetical protein
MYLAKANPLNITFMPMPSDVYGSVSVTFLSVLTKAAPLLSTNLTVKHFLTNESLSTEPITELDIIVRSANV